MILKIGEYPFQDNAVQFSIVKKAIMGRTGRQLATREVWNIWGYLKAEDAAALTSAIDEFQAGMIHGDRGSIKFLDNDGNDTSHVILSENTLNGVRVTGGPDYTPGLPGQWGPNLEYFNRRSFRLQVAAEVPAVEGAGVVYYQETATILAPGFADFVVQEALTGLPQRQETAQATFQAAQQRGRAIGFDGPVFPTRYLWPQVHLKVKDRPYKYEVGTPLEFGLHRNTHFSTEWHFHYEAASGLVLVDPHIPESLEVE